MQVVVAGDKVRVSLHLLETTKEDRITRTVPGDRETQSSMQANRDSPLSDCHMSLGKRPATCLGSNVEVIVKTRLQRISD